jgi:hypothetical protein
MRSKTQKTPPPLSLVGRRRGPPRGRRARHVAKGVRRTWEVLAVLWGKEVSVNKGKAEDIETTVRKSEGAYYR